LNADVTIDELTVGFLPRLHLAASGVTLRVHGRIDGIRGILSSRGSFHGPITDIDVQGTTSTPDFNLDLGGVAAKSQPIAIGRSTSHVVVRLPPGDASLLNMEANVSKAVGGFKSIFLKVLDPFFRKNGRTQVPIKIEGTIEDPRPGLRLGRG
jgi:hypothetical protein